MSTYVTITSVEQLNKIKIVFSPKQTKKTAAEARSSYEIKYFQMNDEADKQIQVVFRITECNMQGPIMPHYAEVKNIDLGPTVPLIKAVLPINSPQFKLVSELERRINTAAAIYAYSLNESGDFIDIVYELKKDPEGDINLAYAVKRNGDKVLITKEMATLRQKMDTFNYLTYQRGHGYSYNNLFFPKENLFYGQGEERRYYKEFRIQTQFDSDRKSREKNKQPDPAMLNPSYWGFNIYKTNGKNGDDFALISNDDLCTKTTPITTPKGQNNFLGGIMFTASSASAPFNSKLNIYMYGTAFYNEIQNSSPKRFFGVKLEDDVKPIEGQTISLAALKASSPTAASAVDKQIEGSEAEE